MSTAWIYDRSDRLTALIERGQEMAEFLRRESCDVPPHSAAWHRLQARLAVVERRVRRLCVCRRQANRMATV
jgi:hypothetical protein